MLTRAINSPSVLAWCPKFLETPIIACGTFSNSGVSKNSKLELIDLSSENPCELQSISAPS